MRFFDRQCERRRVVPASSVSVAPGTSGERRGLPALRLSEQVNQSVLVRLARSRIDVTAWPRPTGQTLGRCGA